MTPSTAPARPKRWRRRPIGAPPPGPPSSRRRPRTPGRGGAPTRTASKVQPLEAPTETNGAPVNAAAEGREPRDDAPAGDDAPSSPRDPVVEQRDEVLMPVVSAL